mgnify:CR=1 FL=1
MKVYTICGSFKFMDKMIEECERLSMNGECILTPVYPSPGKLVRSEEDLEVLRKVHDKKIEMSDGIYILDVMGYIGEDTKREIEYAKTLNKEIRYFSQEKEK